MHCEFDGDVRDDAVAIGLLDGRRLRVRSILPTDGAGLVHFHQGLTSETTRLRFFTVHPVLSAKEVERFTRVDHRDREAIVALDGPDIVAVGRFDRMPGTNDAEVAFVVADAWQDHGVGTCLLQELTVRARALGITGFIAETLGENRRMRDVFRNSGLPESSKTAMGVVRVVMDLR
jgi:GNAT superfamily N-acetyltransferase